MTTIVFDGKTLAVDSQITDASGNGSLEYMNKLWKWDRGYFSVTGKVTDYEIYKNHLNDVEQDIKPTKKSVCVFTEGKNVYELHPGSYPRKIMAKSAWGSGGDLAYGALVAGVDAVRACKLACKWNAYTGGRIRSVKVR